VKLDELDINILSLLARDGRMPIAEIARIIGENKSKVGYRVNSLIENGVISIIGAIDPRVIGYSINADVYVKVKSDKIKEVANAIAAFPEVRFVQIILGEYDVNFQIWTKTLADLHNFMTEEIASIPGVITMTSNMVSEVVKNIYGWTLIEIAGESQNLSQDR
jgi:Lrp/AsnC family transcriptional regulator for asnA, asnC and gidA